MPTSSVHVLASYPLTQMSARESERIVGQRQCSLQSPAQRTIDHQA